jgi:hypothetical protein
MLTVNSFATRKPETCIAPARSWLAAIAFSTLSLGCVQAQTAPARSADTTPAGLGFSIESEMLTYRALESNSEAVACDIAAYLSGGTATFTTSAGGSVCNVKPGAGRAGVIVLPFGTSEFANFQIWRADMATMDRLQRKTEIDCPNPTRSATGKGASSAATAVASSVLSLSPAGPPLALAQSALALMASDQSTSAVGGTIQDQAFMDGVGRGLRVLSVPVLMPSAYGPFALGSLDESSSPFLSSLAKTLADRGCLEGLLAKDDTKNKASVQGAISDIDAFLGTLGETESSTKSATAKTASGTTPAPATTTPATPTPASSAHLSAVLMADGLAQKLGASTDTGALPDEAAYHILLLRALESGGSVMKNTSVLGTKIRYTGGSVGSYALFTTNGDLECSGNVYEYGGSIKASDFQKEFSKFNPDPARQRVFLRGSCRQLLPNR